MHFYLEPGGKLVGSIRVPGDKSMSHRVIMLGAIAEGKTDVSGFLEGEDALSTLGAFRNMGVMISEPESGRLSIEGVGLRGLQVGGVSNTSRRSGARGSAPPTPPPTPTPYQHPHTSMARSHARTDGRCDLFELVER